MVLVLPVPASLLLYACPTPDGKVLGNGVGGLAWDVVTRLDSWKFEYHLVVSSTYRSRLRSNYQILEYVNE